MDLVQKPGALLDQEIARLGQRGELAFGPGLDPGLRQHVLGQEEGERAGIVAVGLLDRFADHLELPGVDRHHPADAGDHLVAEPGAVAGRLDGDLVVGVQAQAETVEIRSAELPGFEGLRAVRPETADGERGLMKIDTDMGHG